MNTYQLIKEIDEIENLFLSKKTFFSALNTYVENYQSFITSFCGTANLADNSQLAAKNNEAKKTISTQIQAFKKVIQPSQFFEDVADIKRTLKEAKLSSVDGSISKNIVLKRLETFIKHYDVYIQHYSIQHTIKMVFEAKNLIVTFETFNFTLDSIKKNIQMLDFDKESAEAFSIYFTSYTDFSDMTYKLNALKNIYEELAELLKISVAENPIQLIKMESGSLWVKFAGNKKVIQFMTKIIEDFAGFIYRNFTSEGEVSQFSKKADAVDSMIGLSEKLKQNNMDTSEMDENIKKSCTVLSKQLYLVLKGQAAIDLNGKDYSVSESMKDKFIEQSKILMIEE